MSARDPSSKREAILRAATELFRRYGYRKTSVDLIAREADVAKPTVYAHFVDKDAVFVAVCGAVMEKILADATVARQRPDLLEQITGILTAKFSTIFELLESSPHARELLESRNAEANAVIEHADARFLELLTAALTAATRRGDLDLATRGIKPPALARLLLQAGHGASYGATTVAQHRAQLAALVAAILR